MADEADFPDIGTPEITQAPSIVIEPTCRYGHGLLEVIGDNSAPGRWSLLASNRKQIMLGMGFSFNIYVCPDCGYSELFDPEPPVRRTP